MVYSWPAIELVFGSELPMQSYGSESLMYLKIVITTPFLIHVKGLSFSDFFTYVRAIGFFGMSISRVEVSVKDFLRSDDIVVEVSIKVFLKSDNKVLIFGSELL